jgi:hypothetical protein
MTLATRWIHKIDGIDLNDGNAFSCRVPDAESEFGAQALLTDMQARTPVFNRQQPLPGRFTFLLMILFYNDAEYLARLATLRGLVAPGLHTYTRAIPGQDVAGQSVGVYFDAGLVVDDTDTGLCTAKAIAPDSTWS